MNQQNEATGEAKTMNEKAQRLNLDPAIYGTFAEIGAGQEVARHFFQAGKASQTIAKTMSAYDMIFSDEIYGKEKNGRYVCESRLNKMLEKESSLLLKRLDLHRGEKTTFFSYANTVMTGTSEVPKCHGWMGIRFQKTPRGPWNDIILHVRMQDKLRLQQQETLGILGVNLVYSAFFSTDSTESFVPTLVSGLKKGQVLIDVIKLTGSDLALFDNRKMNLELVKHGLAEAVLFGPKNKNNDEQILNISDTVWSKGLILQHGFYRPLSLSHIDVLNKGHEQLILEMKGQKLKSSDIIPMFEISTEFGLDIEDFIHRIEIITSLGFHLLISNFKYLYEMKHFFRKFTKAPIVFVMSAKHLEEIFDPEKYLNLDGGIFEALGKLMDDQTKLYIYPHASAESCLTTKSFFPPKNATHLYQHFLENAHVLDISTCDESQLYYRSSEINKMISEKNRKWEELVPEFAKNYIKKNKLWNYKS